MRLRYIFFLIAEVNPSPQLLYVSVYWLTYHVIDTLSNTCEHSVIQKLSYLKNLGLEAKIITVCFLISGPKILK